LLYKCINHNRDIMAYLKDLYIFVVQIKTKKVINKIYINQQKITLLKFDISSRYIIASTEDNIILQFKYNHTSILSKIYPFSLPKKINIGITDFTFYNNLIAIAGNRGQVVVFNLYSQNEKKLLIDINKEIYSINFLNSQKIIITDISGEINIVSLNDSTFHLRVDSPFTTISQLIFMSNKKYLLLCGNTNFIALIDTSKCKIIRTFFISFKDDIHKISLLKSNKLIVWLYDNTVSSINLGNTLTLHLLIKLNRLQEAYRLSEHNPILMDSEEYNRLEIQYSTIIDKAVIALSNNNITLAKQLTNSFINISSKKDEIKNLFMDFKYFTKFINFFSDKQYSQAYNLASKFPALQKTLQYKDMENIFQNRFIKAQKQINLNHKNNATTLLSDYKTAICKREIIQLILYHNKEFLCFLQAIDNKDIKTINKLLKFNKSFAKLPNYLKFKKYIDEMVNKLEYLLYKARTNEVRTIIEELKEYKISETKLKEYIYRCQNIDKLQQAYEKNDFKLCYEIVDTYNLNNLELSKLLSNHWRELIIQCEDYALNGDIKSVKKNLLELIKIKTRSKKIEELLKVSFHNKIKILIIKKEFKNAENIIYSYLDIFEQDEEIEYIMNIYEKLSNTKLAISIKV